MQFDKFFSRTINSDQNCSYHLYTGIRYGVHFEDFWGVSRGQKAIITVLYRGPKMCDSTTNSFPSTINVDQ